MSSPADRAEVVPLAYDKVCELEDFADPELVDIIRDVVPDGTRRFGQGFPSGAESRKHWEVAMAIRALRDHGAVHPDAELLGVGAGSEATLFHLTRYVRRVWATDIYADPGSWGDYASRTMLTNPGALWAGDWDSQRLVVQHMDARELRFPDASFDGAFSSSSIEHFGSDADIGLAMDEVARVLKPGGVFSVATEMLLTGRGTGWPGVRLFDEAAVREVLVGDRPWSLVDDLRTEVSSRTRWTVQGLTSAVEGLTHAGTLQARWATYPHLVLAHDGQLFTSVHLTLRKEGGA